MQEFLITKLWRWLVLIVVAYPTFLLAFHAASELLVTTAPSPGPDIAFEESSGNRILVTPLQVLPGNPILVAALCLALIGINIIIHEVGHAVAAKVVGWRVHIIAAGPFLLTPRARRLHSGILLARQTAGMVFATPPKGTSWDSGLIPFAIGGSLANFLAGAALVVAGLLWPDRDSTLYPFLMGFGMASIGVGIHNLIPTWGPGTVSSDGWRATNKLGP